VRPWYVKPRPALGCIREADRVAALLADYANARFAEPKVELRSAAMAAE